MSIETWGEAMAALRKMIETGEVDREIGEAALRRLEITQNLNTEIIRDHIKSSARVWPTKYATFLVGKNDGWYSLTCLEDQSQHRCATEEEAKTFAASYRPGPKPPMK